jgi:tetratricopeptide (TPR) repeat protein
VEQYRNALPFEEKLVADHPDRPRYRSLLASTLWVLGEGLSLLEQIGESEQALHRSRDVAEKLAVDFPDVPGHHLQVAAISNYLGVILVERGRNREAREAFEQAYKVNKQLAADHPDLEAYRQHLAATCYRAAVNYDTMKGREARDVSRARELARESVAVWPQEAGFWKGLALAEYRAGDLDAALKAETRALELRNGSSYTYDWLLLALIHFARGDRDLARAWFGSAYLAKRAGGSWGGEEDLRRLGAESESVLAELIPRHPEDVRDVWTVLLKDFRQRLGPTHPETLRVMDRLADQLAALGRETQARALFDESRRAQPDRYTTEWPTFGPWFPLAVLTIRHGDVDGYGALCAEMLQRFEGTKEPVVAEQVARMCTLIPGVVDNPRRALELGRKAVAADANQPFFLLARGSAEYRAGQFQAAVETLGESARKNGQPWGRAQAELFLAMAHARLGHAEQARRTLAEAERSLAKLPEKPDVFTLQLAWHWRERAIFQVLLREAATVLGLAPDTMPDGPAAFGP